MEKIEGVDLAALVTESSSDLVSEKRTKAAGLVKQLLQRMEQLATDVKNLEKQLRGKKEKLQKAQDKIEKIKGGDWSVLAEQKEGKKDQQDN